MLANIPRLKAERVLEQARLGQIQLTPDGWKHYTLAATGDLDLAEDAAVAALQREARQREQG